MGETGRAPTLLERIFFETPQETMVTAVRDSLACRNGRLTRDYEQRSFSEHIRIPKDATRHGVPVEAYDRYRLGLVSACADVVCVRDTGGKLEVPLISRAKPPFQGGLWMQGGAIFNFHSVPQFLLWKLFRESGNFQGSIEEFVEKYHLDDIALECNGVKLVGKSLGVYRTVAEDSMPGKVCDTLNLAYLVLWPADLPFGHDKDHAMLRWVTLPDLERDPDFCGHWYPQRLATRALEIVTVTKDGSVP